MKSRTVSPSRRICSRWPSCRSVDVCCLDLFRRHAEQPAGTAVSEHPERAVGPHLDVTNAVADVPALRPLAFSPVMTMRMRVLLARPLTRAEPFHCGNILP